MAMKSTHRWQPKRRAAGRRTITPAQLAMLGTLNFVRTIASCARRRHSRFDGGWIEFVPTRSWQAATFYRLESLGLAERCYRLLDGGIDVRITPEGMEWCS
jgi:hypothetical protein